MVSQEDIISAARKRVDIESKVVPLEPLSNNSAAMVREEIDANARAGIVDDTGHGYLTFPFEAALRKDELSIIAEISNASPTHGVYDPHFPFESIAEECKKAGVDGFSCVTEPTYFKGKNHTVRHVSFRSDTPVLRRDIIVNEYSVHQSKVIGAQAITLVVSALTNEELASLKECAEKLGMSVVFEVENVDEARRACEMGARIVGLGSLADEEKSFDSNKVAALADVLEDELLVLVSGIHDVSDVVRVKALPVDGVFVGAPLMMASNKAAFMSEIMAARSTSGVRGM